MPELDKNTPSQTSQEKEEETAAPLKRVLTREAYLPQQASSQENLLNHISARDIQLSYDKELSFPDPAKAQKKLEAIGGIESLSNYGENPDGSEMKVPIGLSVQTPETPGGSGNEHAAILEQDLLVNEANRAKGAWAKFTNWISSKNPF